MQHAGSQFLAAGGDGHGEAAPGDHLQTGYRLWLVGHQLAHGRAPWLDPYTFQPEVSPLPNFAGWPFGLAYWPLHALFGAVGGWNAFVLATVVLAGLAASAWLRALSLPAGAAAAGGLAFALAPYRVWQSTGHLLGPVSLLLPVALWGIERGREGGRSRAWLVLAAAATASIPLSGQVHLALGTTPLVLAYAVARSRRPRVLAAAAAGAVLAAAAGLAYQRLVVAGSIEAGGRSLQEVAHYSAGGLDFVSRSPRDGLERAVFLGWATPLAALAGAVLLARARRLALLAVLALAVVVPVLLALGTNLPGYGWLWHHAAPFRYPRVPERLLPIAALGIAALVAVAVAHLRRPALVGLALAALVVDLHVAAFEPTSAAAVPAAYAPLASAPPGRLLELPVFLPGRDEGSVYLYGDLTAQRERPLGYALGPDETDALARRLAPLSCGDWPAAALAGLGVRYVAVHGGLYRTAAAPGPAAEWFAWRALRAHGFGPIARAGPVTVFAPGGTAAVDEPAEPAGSLVLCDGWDGARRLVRSPAELWIHATGATLALELHGAGQTADVSVDGGPAARVAASRTLRLALGAPGWHLVRVDRRGHGSVRLARIRIG